MLSGLPLHQLLTQSCSQIVRLHAVREQPHLKRRRQQCLQASVEAHKSSCLCIHPALPTANCHTLPHVMVYAHREVDAAFLQSCVNQLLSQLHQSTLINLFGSDGLFDSCVFFTKSIADCFLKNTANAAALRWEHRIYVHITCCSTFFRVQVYQRAFVKYRGIPRIEAKCSCSLSHSSVLHAMPLPFREEWSMDTATRIHCYV